MGKVNALFQDAEEAKFDRYTHIMVDADVEMMTPDFGKIEKFRISNIPCVWVWDESSREAAERMAVLNYIGNRYDFDWVEVESWSGSPVKKED
jgi:hypothetical protein